MSTGAATPPVPTALVADDEPHLARALVAELGRLWPELMIVHVAKNGPEAAAQIAALQPDMAFLDIQMPGLTGLEVAQGVEGRTRIVFVTAYDEYAVRAFEQEAVDYVLKPVTAERLARTVQRAQRALGLGGPVAPAAGAGETRGDDDDARLLAALRRLLPGAGVAARAAGSAPEEGSAAVLSGEGGGPAPLRWIRASSGDFTHQVAVDDVLFFRADDKYTCVQTLAGAEHLIRTTIQELAAQLDGRQFVQVHRSTIVNLNHLAGTRRDEASRLFLRLKGYAGELPVSRAYVSLFKAM